MDPGCRHTYGHPLATIGFRLCMLPDLGPYHLEMARVIDVHERRCKAEHESLPEREPKHPVFTTLANIGVHADSKYQNPFVDMDDYPEYAATHRRDVDEEMEEMTVSMQSINEVDETQFSEEEGRRRGATRSGKVSRGIARQAIANLLRVDEVRKPPPEKAAPQVMTPQAKRGTITAVFRTK
ncbi:hypothetical protein TI39_contig352g00026 [Zymoseptoria brevis]|uniref:Uncharacterized protein n=1 Tax=Zymoseptoria brevis TaxID=1047168 RepID=A0A0F4GU61_9PEZI|nr:hypothetical protein TI39_contig352g00026 [Zymoseptoria brevis]